MRTIKFRVYNKKTKVLTQPHAISSEILDNHNLIVMQFTGLLDKEGKEIYEGDIVLNHFKKQKLIVFWDTEIIGTKGGGWNYKKFENDEDMTWRIESENIEVISNIYENKDLINNMSDHKCGEELCIVCGYNKKINIYAKNQQIN